MKNHPASQRAFILFTFFLLLLALGINAQNLTIRDIMAEPSIAGMRVEGEKLSPDGTKVVFLWNAEGKMPRDLYLVSTDGGTPAVILRTSDLPVPTRTPQPENKLNYGLEIRDDFVKARENQLGNFEWSPDSKKLVFSYGGDIYVHTLGEKTSKRFTKTQSPESSARFLDNERIIFSQSGNAYVLNTSDPILIQVTKEANTATFISVGNITPNKSGTMVAYVVSDSSKQRALVVPNYLPEFVSANNPRRGWSEQKLFVTPADGSRDTPFEIKLPKPEGVSNFRRMVWTSEGQSLIVDRVDKDTKRRQLFYVHNVGSKAEQIILVTEETDDKWQASLSVIFEPNPKNPAQLFFGSERDGYNHLYLATLEPLKAETRPVGSVPDSIARVAEGGETLSKNVKIKQLTEGAWQVEWAKWLEGGDKIVYSSTQLTPSGREFFVLDARSLNFTRTPAPVGGMKTNPQLSEHMNPKQILIYSSSHLIKPEELFASEICLDCTHTILPKKLTNTTPESFMNLKWNEVKFRDMPSRDGKVIKARIHLPAGHNPKQKYPMAIFVHGAGYLQNTINGWNNYYREFMFNDLLTRKGYVVLDIDYRGSAGLRARLADGCLRFSWGQGL